MATTEAVKDNKRNKGTKATKRKAAKSTRGASKKIKTRTGGKKSKVTGPSVAFNVSVPANVLPKIDKAAKKYAKEQGLSRVSRSAFVRKTLLNAVK